MSQQELAALRQLAGDNELYTLRVRPQGVPGTPAAAAVVFSLPAACFALALAQPHRLDLHATRDGALVGLDFRHHGSLDCGAVADWGAAELRWPKVTDIKVAFPAAGPAVPRMGSAAEEAAAAQYVGQSYQQGSQQGSAGGQGGKDGEKAEAEKKPKTFLERNWILLACGGMLLMNLLNAGGPQPPPPAAAGPRRAVAPAR